MLLLAVVAMMMPAIFELVQGQGLPLPTDELVRFDSDVERLSLITAIVLIGAYVAGLDLLAAHAPRPLQPGRRGGARARGRVERSQVGSRAGGSPAWPSRVMSEILVGSISETAEKAGLSEFFIGAIVVAIVGNAAEHWVAVLVARKDKMDLAVNIAIGSSAQIALFVAPVLVLASYFIGPYPMPLVFNGFELAALDRRGPDRQPGHAGRRVDVVRGHPALVRLDRHRRRVPDRLTARRRHVRA